MMASTQGEVGDEALPPYRLYAPAGCYGDWNILLGEVAILPLDRLKEAFLVALGLPAGYDVTGLEYRSIPEWDSLAHLNLVTAVETTFDVMFDIDDVLGLRSFSACVDILKRHGVNFDE
jgi:hypothetical protein